MKEVHPEEARITVCQLAPDGSEKRVSVLTIKEDEDDKDVCKAGYRSWLAAIDKHAGSMEFARCSKNFEGLLVGDVVLRAVIETEI